MASLFGRMFLYEIFLLSNGPPPPFHILLLLLKKKSSATAVAATGRAAWLFLAGDPSQRIFLGKLCRDFLESPSRNFRRAPVVVVKIRALSGCKYFLWGSLEIVIPQVRSKYPSKCFNLSNGVNSRFYNICQPVILILCYM